MAELLNAPAQDNDADRILVWRENGFMGYADLGEITSTKNLGLTENPPTEINTSTWDGFPMIHQTKTGKILLVHKQGVAHQGAGDSGYRVSLDGGETYGSFISLINEPGKYNGISGGGITPTGRIMLFYFIATSGVGTDEIGYIYSDDDAVTWSEKITVPIGVNVQGGWTGKTITLAGNKLMQCWWGADGVLDQPGTTNTLYAVFSNDNGLTWGDQTVIASGDFASNTAYTEASFVYLEGQNIVGLVRKDRQDYFEQFKSEDNGATFVSQGDATFDDFHTYPAAPELQTFTDVDGKRTVVAYYSNRIELWVRSIIGRDLLSGTSGWILNSRTNIRANFDGDSGYPSVIHPNGSKYGLGVYYEAKSLSDADLQFFKSFPSDKTIVPNQAIFLKQAIVKDGDVAVLLKGGQTSFDAAMLNFVNSEVTANIPAEFRATEYNFTLGNVGIDNSNPIYKLDVNGICRVKRTGMNGLGVVTTLLVNSDAKTIDDGILQVFRGHDSADAEVSYGGIVCVIESPTAGAQSGYLKFRTYNAGVVSEPLTLTKEGNAIVSGGISATTSINGAAVTATGNITSGATLTGADVASGSQVIIGSSSPTLAQHATRMDYVDPVNNVNGAGTLALAATNKQMFYTFTGTTSTWTLPVVSGNTLLRYTLINAGSGNITLNSNSGANDILDAGVAVNTKTIASGSVITLYNNGNNFVVITQ